MSFDIGSFRQRVAWESMAPGTEACGQQTPTYTPRGVFWAAVTPKLGADPINSEQLIPIVTFDVAMRQVGPVAPGDRLVLLPSGRVLTVNTVMRVEERNARFAITATEVAGP